MRAGKILYQYAESQKRALRESPMHFNPIEDFFLARVIEERTGTMPKTFEEVADYFMQIGLDFIKMRELPRERQKELRGLCLMLSEKARNHWQEYHPNGFRSYAA